jgi:ERCC4-type nuclease
MMTLDERAGHTPTQTQSERAGEMLAGVRKLGVTARLGKLESGDASFSGRGPHGDVMVGIEMKTVAGLLTDMTTGRFAGHQVPLMQRAYPYRYLILEGAMRPASDGMLEVPRGGQNWWSPSPRIMYTDFLKFIEDIDLRAGFHIRRTWNKNDTIYHLAAEYGSWQKEWKAHRALKHFNESPGGVVLLSPPTLTRLWARDLPNVGWDRSEAVAKRFKTPLALAQAGIDEWLSVPGIGKTIAWRVWKAIRGVK